jgi:hypothetical protein
VGSIVDVCGRPSSFVSVDGGRLSCVRSRALVVVEGGRMSSFAGGPARFRWWWDSLGCERWVAGSVCGW